MSNIQLSIAHLHQGASSGNKTCRWLSARIRFVPEESLEKIVARGIVAALSWWRYRHHHHHQNNHYCQIIIKENFPTRRIPLSTTQDLCRSITAIPLWPDPKHKGKDNHHHHRVFRLELSASVPDGVPAKASQLCMQESPTIYNGFLTPLYDLKYKMEWWSLGQYKLIF